MPEEVNRIVADEFSAHLFIHSDEARENLRAEGIGLERIHFVGNTMIDTLVAMEDRFRGLGAASSHGLTPGDYLLVTLHRPALVDGPMLLDVLAQLSTVGEELPVVFPIHPRTRKRMEQVTLGPAVRLLDPLGYLEFLSLQADAAAVLTDSGGVQEETTYLGVPCFTLRDNTERPVTVRAGTNTLLGLDPARISEIPSAVRRTNGAVHPAPPGWDGHAAKRIAAVICADGAEAVPPLSERSDKDALVKIWIDLSNSPHPLLFAPIARRLEQAGHDVLITARDNAQTLQLARERWPAVEVIGGDSPRGRLSKVATMSERIAELRRWAARIRPEVALSHNSYAQIVAARSLHIPAVTAMDFEHQPANHLAFRLATRVLVPEMIEVDAIRRQGAKPAKVVQYPGLKEELYIGDFQPAPRDSAQGERGTQAANRRRGTHASDPCLVSRFLEPAVRDGAPHGLLARGSGVRGAHPSLGADCRDRGSRFAELRPPPGRGRFALPRLRSGRDDRRRRHDDPRSRGDGDPDMDVVRGEDPGGRRVARAARPAEPSHPARAAGQPHVPPIQSAHAGGAS